MVEFFLKVAYSLGFSEIYDNSFSPKNFWLIAPKPLKSTKISKLSYPKKQVLLVLEFQNVNVPPETTRFTFLSLNYSYCMAVNMFP